MQELVNTIESNIMHDKFILLIAVLIVFDTILGIARAIKEKKVNSSIGIDGAIRKIVMLISVIFLVVIDEIMNLNLIGFIPKDVAQFLPLEKFGLKEFFAITYSLFELLSVMKNMLKCGMPLPKAIESLVETLLKSMTTEMDNSK